MRKQPCEHKGERRRRARRCSMCCGRDSPAAPRKMTVEQVFPSSPSRGPRQSKYPHCNPWRTLGQSRCVFSEGTVAHGESPQWSRFILKDCSPWRAHTGAEERCEEEGKAGKNCDGLIATPIPAAPSRVGVEESGVKFSLAKGGGKVLF